MNYTEFCRMREIEKQIKKKSATPEIISQYNLLVDKYKSLTPDKIEIIVKGIENKLKEDYQNKIEHLKGLLSEIQEDSRHLYSDLETLAEKLRKLDKHLEEYKKKE